MKLKTVLLPLLVFFCYSFINQDAKNEYTYLLTIESITQEQESFELKITNLEDPIREKKKYGNLKTPYRLELESGIYEIEIETYRIQESIIGKIQGIVNNKQKGFASETDEDKKTIKLKAGPGGKYAAGKW